jgi:hypothetical protein
MLTTLFFEHSLWYSPFYSFKLMWLYTLKIKLLNKVVGHALISSNIRMNAKVCWKVNVASVSEIWWSTYQNLLKLKTINVNYIKIQWSNITCILWTNDEVEVQVEFSQECFQGIVFVHRQKVGMFRALLAPKILYINKIDTYYIIYTKINTKIGKKY